MQGNARMTIGQSLAEARGRAGLSIAAVEEHTRIRGQVITAIEQDEFGPCGGDFYARGHVRQFARVVGLDPQPLLAQFSATPPTDPDPALEPEPVESSAEPVSLRVHWTLFMALASALVLLMGITQSVT